MLPVDKWTLFVPPCGQSREINAAQRLYFCPASWSRRKARYLGVYYDKAVRHIGTIAKVIECEIKGGNVVSEKLLTKDEQNRITAASAAAMDQQGWDITKGYQFLLCDHMCDTEFSKSSAGGIMGHRYFDLRDYFSDGIPTHLSAIAARLRDQKWEEMGMNHRRPCYEARLFHCLELALTETVTARSSFGSGKPDIEPTSPNDQSDPICDIDRLEIPRRSSPPCVLFLSVGSTDGTEQ
jgi:hypothetical protein